MNAQYFDGDMNGVAFIDDSIGYICGSSNTLLITRNGGKSWSQTSTTTSFGGSQKIRFIDKSVGFVVGSNSLCLKTTDGGNTMGPDQCSLFGF